MIFELTIIVPLIGVAAMLTTARRRDPERRRALLADLQRIAGDRDLAREHLLRTSMITGLRRAAAVA